MVFVITAAFIAAILAAIERVNAWLSMVFRMCIDGVVDEESTLDHAETLTIDVAVIASPSCDSIVEFAALVDVDTDDDGSDKTDLGDALDGATAIGIADVEDHNDSYTDNKTVAIAATANDIVVVVDDYAEETGAREIANVDDCSDDGHSVFAFGEDCSDDTSDSDTASVSGLELQSAPTSTISSSSTTYTEADCELWCHVRGLKDREDGLLESARALARRLVPITTFTGRFEGLPKFPARPRWRYYAHRKALFEEVATRWVATSNRFARAGLWTTDDDTVLVNAYRRLTETTGFAWEQRHLNLQWDAANADVNAAAFEIVSEGFTSLVRSRTSTSGHIPLELSNRLATIQALRLKSPCQLNAVTSDDLAGLTLVELRALFHMFKPIAKHQPALLQTLKTAVEAAKKTYDAHRRLQFFDDAGSRECCVSPSTCEYRSALEIILPLYVCRVAFNSALRYIDAEASIH